MSYRALLVQLNVARKTGVDIRVVHRQWNAKFRREQPVEGVQRVEDPLAKVSFGRSLKSLGEAVGTTMEACFVGNF